MCQCQPIEMRRLREPNNGFGRIAHTNEHRCADDACSTPAAGDGAWSRWRRHLRFFLPPSVFRTRSVILRRRRCRRPPAPFGLSAFTCTTGDSPVLSCGRDDWLALRRRKKKEKRNDWRRETKNSIVSRNFHEVVLDRTYAIKKRTTAWVRNTFARWNVHVKIFQVSSNLGTR